MTPAYRTIIVTILSVAGASCAVARAGDAPTSPASASAPSDPPTGVAAVQRDADALASFVRSNPAKQFIRAAHGLPRVEPMTVYYDRQKRAALTPAQAEALDDKSRAALRKLDLDENYYYFTRYGSPLAYARAIDVLAEAGFTDWRGSRILDYGYGGVGHLRMMASCGADVFGVEVDPILPLLYGRPGDQGRISGEGGLLGRLKLVHGQWPADSKVKEAVGGGFDLFISKNTLKNGYIHPAQSVDPRMLVQLGVDEDAFVGELFTLLKPGGLALIYNICPAPAPPDKPYIPWADGRSPFTRSQFEKAGFEIVAYNQSDNEPMRAMARLLKWDTEGGMDLEKDAFAEYTLVRKPVGRS